MENSQTTETTSKTSTPLYEHAKRREWGLAILASEGSGKRRYQFQDGRLREFKKGYYDFLEPVERPAEEAASIVRDLKSMLQATRARSSQSTAPPAERPVRQTLEDQVEIFKLDYPEGFQDESYVKRFRGTETKRRLKRHRDPAIAEAQEKLSAEALDARIAAGEHTGVVEDLVTVLKNTDMLSARDLKPLEGSDPSKHEPLASALRDMLHGDAPYGSRFTRFLACLRDASGEKPGWPLATAPATLVHPDEHVCIKPSVFRRQAERSLPTLKYSNSPSAGLYDQLREMSVSMKSRLEAMGLAPRDLLDVYDFVGVTLTPKAIERMEKRAA